MKEYGKTFALCTAHRKLLTRMSAEQKAALLDALFAYNDGEEVTLDDPLTEMAFMVMTEAIDRMRKFQEQKRKNGQNGGRPKTMPYQNEHQDNQEKPNQTKNNQNEPSDNQEKPVNGNGYGNINSPLSPKGDIPPQGGRTRKEDPKAEYGRFEKVLLSEKEFLALQEKFGIHGTQERIDRLDAYIASTGKKYKSHYATILNWENREMSNKPANVPRPVTVGQQRQQERQVMARMLLEDGDRRRAEEMRDAHGNRVVTQPDGTQLTLPPGW